jgi:spore coat protein CotF
MNEKEMVNDVLSGVNASVGEYAKAIVQCSNGQLRQTLQQMRDGDERFQYDLYKIAEQKGYYKPAQSATSSEMQQLKSQLSQG